MSKTITFIDQEKINQLTEELEVVLEDFCDQWDLDIDNINYKFELSGDRARFLVDVSPKFYQIDDNKYKEHFKKNYKKLGLKLEALNTVIKMKMFRGSYNYYKLLGSLPNARKYKILLAKFDNLNCTGNPKWAMKVSENWVKQVRPELILEKDKCVNTN